jgi:exodeoxyribonuclease VII large subunit
VDSDLFHERGEGAQPQAFGARVLSVRELTRAVHKSLEGLGRLAIEGEVTQIKRAAAGHLYFDLKDLDAKVSCAIWRSSLSTAVRFDLKEGAKVVAHGKLDVYAPRGTYSLIVQRLEQKGIGEQLARLEALKAELKALGWFDRKRVLPVMPGMIGLVTSRDTAALQDFLRTRSLRWPLYPVRLAHTPVQGAAAAAEIAQAIRRIDASAVDVIVVCRGGGSLEDLWCFNERSVAEAIHAASVPVVTGVGHETDTTLADLVADLRAHTPTDAAQTVIPDRARLLIELERGWQHLQTALEHVMERGEERLVRVGGRLGSSLQARLERAGTALARGAARLERHNPNLRLAQQRARLEQSGLRLSRAAARLCEPAQRRLALCEATVQATSPFRVLERGYSITRTLDGSVLKNAEQVAPGTPIETILHKGRLIARVEEQR